MINTGLKKKIVLTTGVNNPYGIGAAIARAFTAEGAAADVTYLRLPAQDESTNIAGEVIQSIRER